MFGKTRAKKVPAFWSENKGLRESHAEDYFQSGEKPSESCSKPFFQNVILTSLKNEGENDSTSFIYLNDKIFKPSQK